MVELMAAYEYYARERKTYAKEFAEKLSDGEAAYFFERLKKHYKFIQKLDFRGSNGGNCSWNRVRLNHSPSVALLAHEIAHAIQSSKKTRCVYDEKGFLKRLKRWHGKQHAGIMKRVVAYIKKRQDKWKAAFNAKIDRHTQAQERRQQRLAQTSAWNASAEGKLAKLEKQRVRWLSKLKRAENRLKKLDSRIKRLKSQNLKGD